MVASVLVAQGRLREAYDLLDVSGLNPPVVYEWLYYALQMQVQVLRGHAKQAAFETLRSYWPTDGLTAINAATAELARAEQEGDAARGVEVYDLVVETVRPIWHEWFQARLRLSTVVVGLLASRRRPPVRRPSARMPTASYAGCSTTASGSSTSTPSSRSAAARSTTPGWRAARPRRCAGGG